MVPRTLAITLIAALVGGCSEPPAEPAPAPPEAAVSAGPGPCDLLTLEQIEGVLEQPVVAGVLDIAGGCTYGHLPNEAGYSAPALTIRFEYADGDPQALLFNYQSMLRSAMDEYEAETIDGLGDAAAWDGSSVVATVEVEPARVAFIGVQLSDVGLGADRERDVARALAELAIASLQR